MQPRDGDHSSPLADVEDVATVSPATFVEARWSYEVATRLLEVLSEAGKKVVTLRYGLDDIQQIEEKCLKKLREAMETSSEP